MFEDYLAVLDSDLYDHKGIAKALLSRIYHLVRRPKDFNEDGSDKPIEDENFCTATQEYLAANLGSDPGTVGGWIQSFNRDGWLTIVEYRNKFGHPRYKYEVPPATVEKVRKRAMAKDASGEYIRKKCGNKVRKTSYKKRVEELLDSNADGSRSPITAPPLASGSPAPHPPKDNPSWLRAGEPAGTVQGSSTAPCGVLHGTVPVEGVGVGLGVGASAGSESKQADSPCSNKDQEQQPNLGSFAPEPRPGASRHPDPSVGISASRPPVPPPPKPKSTRPFVTEEERERARRRAAEFAELAQMPDLDELGYHEDCRRCQSLEEPCREHGGKDYRL
jgi:hypothetical protein